jgi:hypothetical protein
MGYFYFDFRDASKQHRHGLLSSLLFQLSARSAPCCNILSHLHAAHDGGARQPSDQALTKCLKKMLTLPYRLPIYLIIDALDECPDTSGIPSPRDEVLQLITELVQLRLADLHICITTRPNSDTDYNFERPSPNSDVEYDFELSPSSDVEDDFELSSGSDEEDSLTPLRVSLHDESGQREDIMNYVRSVVYSKSERIMRGWGKEDKDLVIETLSKRTDGM